MANLKLIKEIASAKKMTIDELAAKVGINAQAIHVMVRTGSTKIETLEKIAKALEVPAYIFMDYDFDFKDFHSQVILGGRNAFSYFGTQTVQFGDSETVVKSKDETIAAKNDLIDMYKDKVAKLEAELAEAKKK